MWLTPTTMLAPHFSAGELTRDGSQLGAFIPDVTPDVEINLYGLAAALEAVRTQLGVPLRITSGYRPPAKNAAVGGVATSAHMDGLAADFLPIGISQYEAYRRLRDSLAVTWDQVIYYPVQGHIHLSIGPRQRRETRIALSPDPGGTPLLTVGLVERLQGYVASSVDAARAGWRWLLLLALALGAAYLFRRSVKGS